MARSKDYHNWLIESLRTDDREAEAYLDMAFEESLSGDAESIELFYIAFTNVMLAQSVELGNRIIDIS